MDKDTLEKYLGFYIKDLFWVGEKPDISTLKNDEKKFSEELSKVVMKHADENFHLEICRDGLIILKIHKLENLRESVDEISDKKQERILEFNSEYLSYLNTFQFLVASATYHLQRFNYFRNGSLSSHEVFKITKRNGIEQGIGVPNRDITQQFLLGRYLSDYNNNRPIEFDYRICGRHVIEEKVFAQCILDFKSVMQNDDSSFILSQMNSSFSEFSNLNFRQCLVLAWFCIEYFLNKLWVAYLHEKHKENEISGKRREILTGKDFTSSIKSNVLELAGIIPITIFNKIDNVRNKRNKIVHNLDRVKKLADILKESPENKVLEQIKLTDCIDAFDSLIYFCKLFYNIDVRFPVGFSYRPL